MVANVARMAFSQLHQVRQQAPFLSSSDNGNLKAGLLYPALHRASHVADSGITLYPKCTGVRPDRAPVLANIQPMLCQLH